MRLGGSLLGVPFTSALIAVLAACGTPTGSPAPSSMSHDCFRLHWEPDTEGAASRAAALRSADIVSYEWSTHTLTVTAATATAVPRQPPLSGVPFAIDIDGQRAYSGLFYTTWSSSGTRSPVIMVDYASPTGSLPGAPRPHVSDSRQPHDLVRLEILRAIPSDYGVHPDPRDNGRVRACFARLGKLGPAD